MPQKRCFIFTFWRNDVYMSCNVVTLLLYWFWGEDMYGVLSSAFISSYHPKMTLARIMWSLLIVSLISCVWVLTLGIKTEILKKYVLLLVWLSAGALFGDVFFHLLPEHIETSWFGAEASRWILGGILFGLIIEKVIHWRHCHIPTSHAHPHSFAYMNLVWDMFHNFIDGLIVWASYLVSIEVGIATTIAVIIHEVPQEIWDFGVLVHGGFSKKKALMLNFLTALTALLGWLIAYVLTDALPALQELLIPFTIWSFLYIAWSDLIPEMHKEVRLRVALTNILAFVVGMTLMYGLLFLE